MAEFALLAFVMLLGLGAYWSMVIFPKQRDFQKRQRFARELVAGDEVITFGGVIGKVLDVDAELGISQVEIADGVVIRVLNAALMQPYEAEEIARQARMGIKEDQNLRQTEEIAS